MKTKDFIEMLRRVDPDGEAHLRFNNGEIPVSCELKEGYWDGPYTYIDDRGNYVTTSRGYKVDVNMVDLEEHVWNVYDHYDSVMSTWEGVRNMLVFDFGNYTDEGQRKGRENIILAKAEEHFKEANELYTRLHEEKVDEAVSKIGNNLDSKKKYMSGDELNTWLVGRLVSGKMSVVVAEAVAKSMLNRLERAAIIESAKAEAEETIEEVIETIEEKTIEEIEVAEITEDVEIETGEELAETLVTEFLTEETTEEQTTEVPKKRTRWFGLFDK